MSIKKTSEVSEARTLWPHFLIYINYAFTVSVLIINIVIIAGIMWPGDIPFAFELHAGELGILTGTSIYIIAISGILFGYLADKFSRTKLMAFVEITYGIGLFFNGFIPAGQDHTTYFFFLIFSLVRGFSIGGFWPLITSHVDDSTETEERSQFFGTMQASFQVFQIFGMFVSAILFQNNYWRIYFIAVGILALVFGFVILIRGKEPKRGAKREELKQVLSSEDVVYEYKLTKDTIRSTIFAPTNLIAFFEGVFTTILLGVPDFLMVAYLQSPPYNFSPFISAIFLIIFGLPGGLIGSLAFAKISDKLGKKSIKYRIYMIVLSTITLSLVYIVIFNLPLPIMTPEQGNNILFVLSVPVIWIMGLAAFIARAVVGLWNINQPPVLQQINLPEAQGKIISANQFLESLGAGTGPIIAGFILIAFNQNFQLTVLITMILGTIGGLLWLLATIWVEKDVSRVSAILGERKKELSNSSKSEKI
ncbi:MAG: MFS transporter [Promethearchaeota archaeon]